MIPREDATEDQLAVTENRNLAIRLWQRKHGNATVSNRCTYGRDRPNGIYTQLPVRVYVLNRDENDPVGVGGSVWKTLPRYVCESCGWTSSTYSNFIFVAKVNLTPLPEMRPGDESQLSAETQIPNLYSPSAMRACIFCCEGMHQCEYGIGVQPQAGTMRYVQTEQWKSLVKKDVAFTTDEILRMDPQLATFARQRGISSMEINMTRTANSRLTESF